MVTSQTAKIGASEMTLLEQRQRVQSLEMDLNLMRLLKTSLENSQREAETRYARQMEQEAGACSTWRQSWPRPGQRGSTRPC